MSRKQRDEINVRWVDTTTGEDFTDLMNDPSIPPGEGILELARALRAGRSAPLRITAELAGAPDAGHVGWSSDRKRRMSLAAKARWFIPAAASVVLLALAAARRRTPF